MDCGGVGKQLAPNCERECGSSRVNHAPARCPDPPGISRDSDSESEDAENAVAGWRVDAGETGPAADIPVAKRRRAVVSDDDEDAQDV